MKAVIAGGTGLIGRELTRLLEGRSHEIIILTRGNGEAGGSAKAVNWLQDGARPEKEIGYADAFINLAGASINAGRWNARHRKEIYESRMRATEELLRIIAALPQKPKVLVNASAIGIYPPSLEKTYTEQSGDLPADFLGETVKDWENKAAEAETYGVRTAFMRFGIVLDKEEGALPLMVMPYKWYAGGTIGSGKQWVSWVHVADAARAVLFAVENEGIRGPVNVTAPNPVTMKEFGKTIGALLHRPHWLHVPSFALKWALGKKSSLILEGQRAYPARLEEAGFVFRFPDLKSALEDLLKKGG
ncbi:TIGR01777 family oxidoreductase [Caldibacillus debilis]|uniref:TIGR01777 family oxidoreductase n=1 Tax=Caldibacillus debilis TaxID=301148 RepID=UPI00035D3796|nr:TIGR01777 family oxidoreductase [Caldibacillus debilis]